MSFSRYKDRQTLTDIDYRKQKKLKQRKETLSYFETSSKKIDTDYENFSFLDYTWKNGDKLYKLAQRFYDDPMLWWIIAEVNNKPTDFHFSPGETIRIPNPNSLEEIVKYLGY